MSYDEGEPKAAKDADATIITEMSNQTIADELSIPVSEADHALGNSDAPVTLVEYGDYECPECLNAFPIVRRLQERFGQRLRFVFRHFPRNSIHPHAGVAAQAAEAAALQGKFWEMHEMLFANQQRLGDVDFGNLALRVGAELYNFESSITSDRVMRRVEQDYQSGQASGVRGTPTFFINGRKYPGKNDFDSLAAAIERATAERATTDSPSADQRAGSSSSAN
jgi:protein-disulfide isomerase